MCKLLSSSSHSLLASCFDAEDTIGGGLFVFDGESLSEVDRVSSTGLYLAGETLLRCLWSDTGVPAELLVYDEHGVVRYHRLDGVTNPHDVCMIGEDAVIVATAENQVVWLAPNGKVVRRWQPEGEPDSWHLNGLIEHRDRVLVSAFGRFARRKGWDFHGRPQTGCLVDIETGENVLTGLHAPHSPRFVEGSWLVCNSASEELIEVRSSDQRVVRRIRLGGWPRGLAVSDTALFVGVSPMRHGVAVTEGAKIVMLDRESWDHMAEVQLPAREVYDLALVPAGLMKGIKRGFGSNATREREQVQLSMFETIGVHPLRIWAIGDPIPLEACRVTMRLDETFPGNIDADSIATIRCHIRNRGKIILTPAPPNPVRPVHSWVSAFGNPVETEIPRAKLSRSVPPNEEIEAQIMIRAPATPGTYRLHLTVAQDGVAWFDDIDPDSGIDQYITVK